jgi:alcohol dehydrogenase class IV
MPIPPENLAMIESDWPGAGWNREEGTRLVGPRRGEELRAHTPGRLAKFHAPEIVFGPGALAELGHCAARLGARRPFLVTDPGLIEAGWVDEAVACLRQSELYPALWHDVTANPKDHEIEAAFSRYAESGSDVIIGLGGGSCIDAAKGVAILSGNGGRILGYEGVDKVVRPIPPTVMVPSTSGTGADVSQFAIVTDTAARSKITIISRTLVPEISVIDPRLLTTMPDWLNASTGLDALTHGIEAFVSRAHNPLTDRHALYSVALITRHLLRSQLRPTETASRLAMAQGALEAGMAFTNAILGATHAMSHQVGGQLDAPHGVVNAVLLPHVIMFNAEVSPGRFVPLAEAGGIRTEGVPAAEVALLLAEGVRKLADEAGMPKGLAELGVTDDLVPQLARLTLKDACLATNPRSADARDIEALFRAAL